MIEVNTSITHACIVTIASFFVFIKALLLFAPVALSLRPIVHLSKISSNPTKTASEWEDVNLDEGRKR